MKPQTGLIALIYGLMTLIILPLVFIKINLLLTLPIYSSPFLKIVGIILIIIGLTYWLYSIMLFFKIGKGTPVPTNPPQKLVTTGVYKYTRNPMYISVMFILLGYFFVFGYVLLIAHLLIMITFFHFFITLYEEPTLTKKFGKSYIEYCKKVPRWLK